MAENNGKIFIDSNFYIALYNLSDSLHQRAEKISKKIKKENLSVFLSNFIFLETITVLSQRSSRESAIASGKKLMKNPRFILIGESIQNKSWQIFQEIKNKNISFVDCSILAVMQFYGIRRLLTFDKTDFSPLRKKYAFRFY